MERCNHMSKTHNLAHAKTLSQLSKFVYQRRSFLFGTSSVYPRGRAAMIEVSSDIAADMAYIRGDATSVAIGDALMDSIRRSILDGHRTFVVLSYDVAIGFFSERRGKMCLTLDPENRHLTTAATATHINEWIAAADDVDSVMRAGFAA